MNVLENSVLASAEVTESTLVVICKVSDITGAKGSLNANLDNIARTDKAVMLTATAENGKSFKLLCSGAVGQAIRAKQLKLSDMGSFPVIEYTTQSDSSVIPMVTMPQGSAITVGVEASKFSKVEFKRTSVFNPADLIAL